VASLSDVVGMASQGGARGKCDQTRVRDAGELGDSEGPQDWRTQEEMVGLGKPISLHG